MRPIDVIPSKRLKHIPSGKTYSTYGACPATGKPGDTHKDYETITIGWTVLNDNGTVGCGRPPWENKEAAETFLFQHGSSFDVQKYKNKNR
jgi:hypothetical protein